MIKVKQKKRIRIDRVMILVGGCVLCAILLVGGFSVIRGWLHHEIIAQLYADGQGNKLEDDKRSDMVYSEKNQENEESIYALHMPQFSDDEANQKVNEFVESLKRAGKKVTYVDYESSSAFNQYKSYQIEGVLFDDIDGINPINESLQAQLVLHFDKEKLITLKDCLREREIMKLAKQYECDEDAIVLSKITETGLILNINGQETAFNYSDHEKSFIMDNENIPTILKYPKIEVAKRELDERPMIAFTFDDGPDPYNTERLLKAFQSVNGRATFFELGQLMELYPETVRAVTESGCEVASHSYKHDWLTHESIEDALKDLESVSDIYFSLTGNDIRLVRPPYGDINTALKEAMIEKVVMWDVDTRDWESRNTEKVIEMAKNYTYENSIVLFHDIHATTIPAVEALVKYYDSLGYQFVTVSELYEALGK